MSCTHNEQNNSSSENLDFGSIILSCHLWGHVLRGSNSLTITELATQLESVYLKLAVVGDHQGLQFDVAMGVSFLIPF